MRFKEYVQQMDEGLSDWLGKGALAASLMAPAVADAHTPSKAGQEAVARHVALKNANPIVVNPDGSMIITTSASTAELSTWKYLGKRTLPAIAKEKAQKIYEIEMNKRFKAMNRKRHHEDQLNYKQNVFILPDDLDVEEKECQPIENGKICVYQMRIKVNSYRKESTPTAEQHPLK